VDRNLGLAAPDAGLCRRVKSGSSAFRNGENVTLKKGAATPKQLGHPLGVSRVAAAQGGHREIVPLAWIL
jgi:hypothetical protein